MYFDTMDKPTLLMWLSWMLTLFIFVIKDLRKVSKFTNCNLELFKG